MSRAKFGFDYCALRYLNMWLEAEKEPHEAFSNEGSEDDEGLRKRLAKFAFEYRIARNLPKKHEVGQRFQPILDIFATLKPEFFEGGSLSEAVTDVSKRISEKYNGRGVLSATTKFLWLKFRTPIIIYDRQARETLKTADGDLVEFYKKWRDAFQRNESKVEAACNLLASVHRYTVGTSEYIAQIACEPWFKERVFDIYLWNRGSIV